MKLKRLSIGTLGLLAVSGFAWSCSGKSEDCNANLNCAPYGGEVGYGGSSGAASASGSSGTSGATGGMNGKGGSSSSGSGNSGDGGADAAAGSGGAMPSACDGSLSPEVDGCVISDEYGVFVSAAGSDTDGKGTQAAPFATVTGALAQLDQIKHVYVCAADYVEPETLEIPDRVSIYGGFSCDGGAWKYDSPFPAHLLSARPIGATITSAKVGVLIQDLRIDAANAPEDGTGASSFGMLIIESKAVVLKHVEIRAGKGGKGKTGSDGATGLDGVDSGDVQKGVAGTCTNPPTSLTGAQPVQKICESQGGLGGTAFVANTYSVMQDGSPGYLVSPSNGGKGGDVFGQPGTRGQDGAQSMQGDAGEAAPALGMFSATGYKVANGGTGVAGKPGQGGGGGGASLGSASCIGATGGAGGMGGCGGDPGVGGTGGGASVALLSWQSMVSLDGCKLTANTGGAGGDGGKGHAGGSGKTGGSGGPKMGTVGKGGDGGSGGDGADGGNGAGGTGGPSIALVYDIPVNAITLPTYGVATTPSAPGKGGTFGKPGPDGSKGLTQETYSPPSQL